MSETQAGFEQRAKKRARGIFNSLVHASGWFVIDQNGERTFQVGDNERTITLVGETRVEFVRPAKRKGSKNFFRATYATTACEGPPYCDVEIEGTPNKRDAEILAKALSDARSWSAQAETATY